MVDPIITYAFAALFFVVLLGSMLYLTFMTHETGDEAKLGESVVRGAGAQERSDDLETAELAADTDGDEVTEPRHEDGDGTDAEADEGTDTEDTDASAPADGDAEDADAESSEGGADAEPSGDNDVAAAEGGTEVDGGSDGDDTTDEA